MIALKLEIEKKLKEPKFFMDRNYWDNLLISIRITINKRRIAEFFQNFKDFLDTENLIHETGDIQELPDEQSNSEEQKEKDIKKTLSMVNTIKIKMEDLKGECISMEEYNKQLNERRATILKEKFENFIMSAIGASDALKAEKIIPSKQIISKIDSDILKFKDMTDYGRVQDSNILTRNLNELDEEAFRQESIKRLKELEKRNKEPGEIIALNIMSLATEDLKPEEIDAINNQDWIDILTPRKPHYFNRVHFGYEWTKHNLIHYTIDERPPKDVMGYRFNIFYPNLINKKTIPEYKMEITENPDFAIIKFNAGPPYEELKFKIVNKKWDLADRKGFKCLFDRGILHLYFDFERNRFLV